MSPTTPARRQPWAAASLTAPLLDAGLAAIAFVIAYIIRYELQILRPVYEVNRAPFEPYIPYMLLFTLLLYLSYQGSRLYKSVRGRSWLEEVWIIINGVTSATVLLMAISFVTQPLVFSRLMLIYAAALTILLLAVQRALHRVAQAQLRSRGVGVRRVLVVGAGEVGRAVLRTMLARKELGYAPVGFLDDNPERGDADLGRLRGLGSIDRLAQTIRTMRADTVVITLSWSEHDRIVKLVKLCQDAGVEVLLVPDVFQLNLRQVQVEALGGIALLQVNGFAPFPGINRLVKRVIDLTLIVLALPILLPVFALLALAIRLEDGGPVFFTQRRVGENGREFRMFKFRSMIVGADRLHDELVQAWGEDPRHPKGRDRDPRVTRVGRFIRRTSLDELPNLLNVMRGEMSLVGPRPPTPNEVALYEPWHMQRLSIMPGITGLWQINGRSDVPFDEMCLLDIYYIENWSLTLDAQILMLTIPRVLLRQGAY